MNISGFLCWKVTTASGTAAEFQDFIWFELMWRVRPYPEPNSLLVADNASIHGPGGGVMRQWFEDFGARVRIYSLCEASFAHSSSFPQVQMLPPYSPHLNPIELAFRNLKMWIKRHANTDPLAVTDQPAFLSKGFAALTPGAARGLFREAGY